MSDVTHTIEALADKLADRMQHEADLLARYLTPPGARPPFATPVNLDWWRANRQKPEIMAYMAKNMAPEEIMALDAALSDRIEQERMAPPVMGP